MYSSPHQDARRDSQDIIDMQKLLAAGWQHTAAARWMSPDDDTPLTLKRAMQIAGLTHPNRTPIGGAQ